MSWMPFLVRAVQIYFSTNFPQVAMLAPTAADVPRVPRAAGPVRLLHDDLRRRRPHRQRSARQRAADLPVEAAAAHRVHRRQGRGALLLPAARSPACPAILLLLRAGACSPATSSSCARTCFCFRPSPSPRCCRCCSRPSRCWRCRRSRRAAATWRSSTPASSSSPRRSIGVLLR